MTALEPRGILARVLQGIPALIVFAALIALGLWGHASGWTLPKSKPATNGEAWCTAHSVPEVICVECKESLLPRLPKFGWCDKHLVPECPMCHPELAQVNGTPKLPKYNVIAARNLLPRTANDKQCKLHDRRVQLASDAAAKKAGIDIAVVTEGPIGEYVSANGEAVFDPKRVARLSSPVAGRVAWVGKEIGQPVIAGETVALIESTEIGKVKSDLLQSAARLDFRRKVLTMLQAAGNAGSPAQLREAEAEVRDAEVRVLAAEQALANHGLSIAAKMLENKSSEEALQILRSLGVPPGVPDALKVSTNLLPLRAPYSGTLVTRDAVAGEVVDPSKVLFVVADPSKMQLTLQVREEDARFLRPGQTVLFDDSRGQRLAQGTISVLSQTIDHLTRTLPVLVPLDNAEGKLRNNTFGTARIVLREEPNAILAPANAVHWDGSCHVVFVRDKNYLQKDAFKVYHVRKVVPGARTEAQVELLSGALPGEVVAAKGSATFRGEILKDSFGEG